MRLRMDGETDQACHTNFVAEISVVRAMLPAVLYPAHNDLCPCDRCRDRRMSQWRGEVRTPDRAWIIPRLFSCGDHLEFTRTRHPRNDVVLDGRKCLYCHAR